MRGTFCEFLSNLSRIPPKSLVALINLWDDGTFLRLLVLLTFAITLLVNRITSICVLIFCSIKVLHLLNV
jgi:hypothetical protein